MKGNSASSLLSKPRGIYEEANAAYDNKDYVKAIDLFDSLGDYKDSREKKNAVEKEIKWEFLLVNSGLQIQMLQG